MTASTADYYSILGLISDATLADVKNAYRKLTRQHHPDRTNADPGAIDRFRRITEAYEYLSAHLKDNAHGNGHSRPGPAVPPRAHAGMPGGYSEAASRVLTMLEQTWQAIRARHPEIPPGVIIAQRHHRPGRQTGPLRPPAADRPHHRHPDKILLMQTAPVTDLRGWYGACRPQPRETPQRSLARHHSVWPPRWRITTIR